MLQNSPLTARLSVAADFFPVHHNVVERHKCCVKPEFFQAQNYWIAYFFVRVNYFFRHDFAFLRAGKTVSEFMVVKYRAAASDASHKINHQFAAFLQINFLFQPLKVPNGNRRRIPRIKPHSRFPCFVHKAHYCLINRHVLCGRIAASF